MFPKKINGNYYCAKSIRNGDSATTKTYGRCKPNPKNVKCKACKNIENAKRLTDPIRLERIKLMHKQIISIPWYIAKIKPEEAQNNAKLP